GGFHRNVAVFNPSPEVKLFGSGNRLRRFATAGSSGLFDPLLPAARVSYVRTQPTLAAVGQRGTSKAPVLGSTNNGELRRIGLLPPILSGLFGSGTKYRNIPARARAV